MSVSLWRRSADPERVECEVCVVGGGICGLSAALELQRRGVRTVLVEGSEIGAGASGRNAGYLIRGAADNYAHACREYGRERAAMLWRWTEENLRALREEGIEELAGFEARPSCLIALHEEEEAQLVESARLLREDGFEVELLGPGEGPDDALGRSGRVLSGLVNPGDGVCSPIERLGLLRDRLTEVEIRCGQEAHTVRGAGRGVEVVCSDVRVSCERVFVALNAYGPSLLPGLEGVVCAHRGQMLAARPIGRAAPLEMAYYANHGSEYFRPGPGGTIVFGGARTYFEAEEAGTQTGVTRRVQERLERFMRELVTDRFEVIARWSGTMGFSPDGLPLAGEVPVEGVGAERVWFCGGYTGHGMSMAFTTARAAV
ncbi:MAG: NAD(P)/FAD-dependent oxidoreductase, partial [Phycisphaerales bacterium JB059]